MCRPMCIKSVEATSAAATPAAAADHKSVELIFESRVLQLRPIGRPAWTSPSLRLRQRVSKSLKVRFCCRRRRKRRTSIRRAPAWQRESAPGNDRRSRARDPPPQRPLRRSSRRHYSRKVSPSSAHLLLLFNSSTFL